MHELSIAEAIVDIAQRHAHGRRVYRVAVKVGHLRQVVPDALQFAFELLTDGTELEGAELAIEEVPAEVRCRGCARVSEVREFPLQCAGCGSLDVVVCAGEELLVDELDVEEAELSIGGMAHGS
jgi:hydrogenase nickel incorporation protein HypA/HybF